MFNFTRFTKAMSRNVSTIVTKDNQGKVTKRTSFKWVQTAAAHNFERQPKYGEIKIQPISMPGWTFFFKRVQVAAENKAK